MTWRVHISDSDFLFRGCRIFVAQNRPGGTDVLGPGGEVAQFVPDGQAALDMSATLYLPDGADHALLAALSRHLGAVEHPQQLRKDYEAERARVDLLVAHLIGGTS